MSSWKNVNNLPDEGKVVLAAWFNDDSLMLVGEAQYLKGKWYSLEDEVPHLMRVNPTHWMYLGDYYLALQEITRETE